MKDQFNMNMRSLSNQEQPQKDEARERSMVEEEEFLEGKANIGFLRMVAPKKAMYCATFRLPREVAFRQPKELTKEEVAFEKQKQIWLRSDENVDWPGNLDLRRR